MALEWPDHPLAVSGGEILMTRILPLLGHNARDFARAAAVCRGWRGAVRTATAARNVYREVALLPIIAPTARDEEDVSFEWSPCGKFVVATACRPPRLFIWRTSTGDLVTQFPIAEVPPGLVDVPRLVFFSTDNKVLTMCNGFDDFSVWSVPDGRLIAANAGDLGPHGGQYRSADFGIPGSASAGLVGFSSYFSFTVDLWTVDAVRSRRQSRVELEPGAVFDVAEVEDCPPSNFAFSPDGSKFVVAFLGTVYVFDVASLARLAVFASPSRRTLAAWSTSNQRILVYGASGASMWDLIVPPPPVVVDVGRDAVIHGWFITGATYSVLRTLNPARTRHGLARFAMDIRRMSDGATLRSVTFHSDNRFNAPPRVVISYDERAILVHPSTGAAARIILFE